MVCPDMPHPVYFIKCFISPKPFRSTHLNHIRSYNVISYDKTHSITLTRMSPVACPGMPYPLHFIKGLYFGIHLDLHSSVIYIHVPYNMTHSLTLKGKTHRACPGLHHPFHFINALISRKQFRSPPTNHM